MISIKGQYEFTDFKNAQRLNVQRGKLTTWAGYFVVGILGLSALVGTVYAALGRVTWSYVAFPTAFIVLYVILQYVVGPRQLKRIFNQQKDLSAPFDIQLSDEAFEMRNEFGSSRLPWRDVAKWKEDDHMILLYKSDVLFHMLPRRFFQDNNGLEFVHEKLSQAKVPDARRVRNPVMLIIWGVCLLLIVVVCITSYITHLH